MAEVYWIRLPEHTDMFSEGYIGVTKNTARSRFRGHVAASKTVKGFNYRISNVIRKYGSENLLVETLVICDEEYAYLLESKLRVDTHIGWNIAAGGVKSGSYAGYTLSDETKRKMSDSYKSGNRVKTEQHRLNLSKSLSGKVRGPLSTESINKRERTRFLSMWELDPNIWSNSDIWFDYHKSGKGKARSCENYYKLKHQSLVANFNRFESGWVPYDDIDWIKRFKEGVDVSQTS